MVPAESTGTATKRRSLPFAKMQLALHPGTLVQEDKAPGHASRYQKEQFDAWEVEQLL